MGSMNLEKDGSNKLLEALDRGRSHAFDFVPSMALRCALQLGIPDIISDHPTPITLPELVSKLSIPEAKSNHLGSVMRLLTHMGFFAAAKNHQDQDGYTLTEASELLVTKGRQTTLAPFLLMVSDPAMLTPCLYMADWFRGADPTPFEATHGVGFYEYLQSHSDFSTTINQANASFSDVETRGLLEDLIPMLKGFESLVDVGGGTGMVASIISEAAPHLKCTVYDLPVVISDAKPKGNIAFVAGDMFESIPSADIIFSKGVFTAFPDEDCVKILKRCLEAVRRGNNPQSKVVMVDAVRDKRRVTSESIKTELCGDLLMMTGGDGKERTEMEWKKLFVEAGFASYKITPYLSVNCIIEIFA